MLSGSDLADIFAAGNANWKPEPSRLRCPASLPYPVVARDDFLFREIRDTLIAFDQGAALADPEVSEMRVAEAIQEIYADHPQAVMAQWSDSNRALAAAISLVHAERGGPILRTTDALETLLAHSDIDGDLPTSLFLPPHPALYVHFGPAWRERLQRTLGPALALAETTPDQAVVHGCYLVQSRRHCPECGSTNRVIGLYYVVELLREPGFYQLSGGGDGILHDEDAPLSETFVDKFDFGANFKVFGDLPRVLVDLLAKLFLYMQSDGARSIRHDDLSALTPRLAKVGAKKAGKLQRRSERAYDWMEVGPAALPPGLGHGELPAHWRRGHLRQQAHGPQYSLRKVIFIAPTVVRADKLETPLPAPGR